MKSRLAAGSWEYDNPEMVIEKEKEEPADETAEESEMEVLDEVSEKILEENITE